MLQPNHIVAGRYRVVRHIADGGMGAVYEAEHLATEGRVALKLLLPQTLHVAMARRRFELEAKVAARVNSEHIVRVFDAGVDEATRSPYLAMELLAGETLAACVRHKGPLEPAYAVEVLRQVARGLDAAHGYRAADGAAQPIVHRDLKPENLFLARRADGSPLVKIVDFGIAKVLSESTAVSREVRGTPLYMAYEQVAGEAISPQTDIWALGLVTYFMLTGRSYWPAASKATPSTEALFAQILTLPLLAPSQRLEDDGLDLRLPAAFDRWLLTCLEREPARRFGSAGIAVAALERALASLGSAPSPWVLGAHFGSRVTARYELPANASTSTASSTASSAPPVASEPRRAPERASRAAWPKLTGAVAIACLVAAGITWGVVRLRGREPIRDAAVAPERAASGSGGAAPASGADARSAHGSFELRANWGQPAAKEALAEEARAKDSLAEEPIATEPAARGAVLPEVSREANPENAPPPPRVTVKALRPATSSPAAPAMSPAAADAPSRPPRPSSPPVVVATPSRGGGAAPEPADKTPAVAPCTFDPYTGRCTVVLRASPVDADGPDERNGVLQGSRPVP